MAHLKAVQGRKAPATPPSRPLGLPGIAALALLLAGLGWLAGMVSLVQAALLLVGSGLGVVLYHAAFGFTSGWRRMIVERRGRGLRAQMLLLAVAVVLFFPPLASGTLFGHPVHGFVSPIGVSVVAGAFMFGLGMQLGGGCASGTLFTAGGGNARMVITLVFFIIGSVLATIHFDWWMSLPALAPVSLPETMGSANGIFLSLALFGVIALATLWLEKRRHGSVEASGGVLPSDRSRWLRGPWPLLLGALALALLNFATLALAGRPWGITSAFALWGAKGAAMIGFDPGSWAYWQDAGRAASLKEGIDHDVTSVMNIGIVLGAMVAASLAGRFAPNFRIPLRSVAAAVIGGLLLGYGARIAFGCNIGAYFSGIASGSLHGWVWMVFAFAGNMLGVRLRPFFFRAPYRPAVKGC
ncbi:YeeE/YedE family protein [Larsenimonas rhizosphaerae]|uniref:YeeE/YedE family protein n=1 Tax=Larsenimonas rhizosphaerae TaxID=2944682 RepID=UPI0020340BFA|nr:YeeE/YedE family protein [Larsenimonas rhizosphaerae]MCM2129645.1 YeeE/YedE family protein [Larsenimonas rhizosphaerae]